MRKNKNMTYDDAIEIYNKEFKEMGVHNCFNPNSFISDYTDKKEEFENLTTQMIKYVIEQYDTNRFDEANRANSTLGRSLHKGRRCDYPKSKCTIV